MTKFPVNFPVSRESCPETVCPSSDDLRLIRRFEKGGSGSFGLEIMQPAIDAARGGLRRKRRPVSSHHRKSVVTNKLRKISTRPTKMPLGKRPSCCERFGWPARPMRLLLRHQKGQQEKGHLVRKFLRRAESRLLYERPTRRLAYQGLFSGPTLLTISSSSSEMLDPADIRSSIFGDNGSSVVIAI
jgi:hypothetical protein